MGGKTTVIKEGKTYYQFSAVRKMLKLKDEALHKLINEGVLSQTQFRENGPLYIPRSDVISYVQRSKR